jgi:hypothetical protein
MAKMDFKKELKHLYNPTTKAVTLIDVPAMNFVQIDGTGDPNKSEQFQEALTLLFSISYTIKFMIKKRDPAMDYGVMPLEGLWWADAMQNFNMDRKDLWKWRLMIMQPNFVTPAIFTEALETVGRKKNLSGLERVSFHTYHEGSSAQIMHIGPFSTEGPNVAKIHEAIHQAGYEIHGLHHEIYLSDFHKTNPEKLRTIIRQPYRSSF